MSIVDFIAVVSFGLTCFGLGSVSYTHLDVYKRQTICNDIQLFT